MKKGVLLFLAFLLVASLAQAQIISNFTSSKNGAGGNGSSGTDSVYLTTVTDTSSVVRNCLGWSITLKDTYTSNNAQLVVNSGDVAATGAQVCTYWVYLDSKQNIPDSLEIGVVVMDRSHWSWKEVDVFACDIPHDIWYPLSENYAELRAKYGTGSFDNNTYDVWIGMQIWPGNTAAANWSGQIYVDDITLLGVLPTVVQDFNTTGSIGTFAGNGSKGTDSLYQTTYIDTSNTSNGVMAWEIKLDTAYGSSNNAQMTPGSISADTSVEKYEMFWVYLPSSANIPDSLVLGVVTMPNSDWNWKETDYFAKDIPKDTWYPLSRDLMKMLIVNPNDYYNSTKLLWIGMQIYYGGSDTTGKLWGGTIYVNEVDLLSAVVTVPAPTWTAANFESKATQSFYVPSNAVGTLKVVVDTKTSNGSYVLQDAEALKTTPGKIAIRRDSVAMECATDTFATALQMDLYLPKTVTKGGYVNFYVSGGTGDSVSVVSPIDGSAIQTNSWNTLTITKLDSLKTLGLFDPTKKASIGVEIYYTGDTATWSGNVWFDNLIITGEHFDSQLPTGVATNNNSVVKEFALYNNYPNPFNPSTTIKYDVAKDSKVLLQVFDILGREVATLVNNQQSMGSYTVQFNASKLSSGVYFCRLTAGSFVKMQKMMLVK